MAKSFNECNVNSNKDINTYNSFAYLMNINISC